MRWSATVLLAACVFACGDKAPAKTEDAGTVADSPSPDAQSELPPACETPVRGNKVLFELVARTQGAAVLVTSPPGDLRRFVLEQEGRIKILTDTGLGVTPFLDLSAQAGGPVACCGEQGLLGLAFHPSYNTNRTFFIYYSTPTANIVARYQTSITDPDRADPASGVVLISMMDLATNHNGGMMEFGPDGFLYISTGDGGWDSQLGQNPNGLYGKMLRIDVDRIEGEKLYGIPPSNPFAAGGGAQEVYSMGLRNPWRWSFDRQTGDIWIGDVGQGAFEEIDMIPAGTPGALNFGWHKYEGTSCFAPPCDPVGFTPPQVEKSHAADGWCSIIGGEVYRGGCYPDLAGTYFATDYCKAELLAVAADFTSTIREARWTDATGMGAGVPPTPSSLHSDARGELYLTTTTYRGSQINGGVYRVVAEP